jgi:hypothetical protein
MLQVPIYTSWFLVLTHTQVKKTSPSPGYISRLRPAPPYIIDLLPPVAYPNNASTSLCTKFVHTSTNKVRGPVNCVTVSSVHDAISALIVLVIIVDTNWPACPYRFHVGRVHPLERVDLQLRNHSSGT